MNKNIKVFIAYIALSKLEIKIIIYIVRKVQIILLSFDEIFKSILAKYLDFANMFLKKLAMQLSKYLSMKKYTIKLEKDKQSSYISIYSLGIIELKIFKTYIKINPANSFILLLKSLIKAFIIIIKKFNNRFCLYVNY